MKGFIVPFELPLRLVLKSLGSQKGYLSPSIPTQGEGIDRIRPGKSLIKAVRSYDLVSTIYMLPLRVSRRNMLTR